MNEIILSKSIEVSEDNHGNLLLDFIICDFETNRNGKKINRDTINNWLPTLINQPLVGRISKIANTDEFDFTSHNKKTKYVLENGKLNTKTILDTDAIGTFLSAEVKNIDGKDYVTAQALMWGRFENAKNVILNKIANNEPLFSSWELCKTNTIDVIEDGQKIELINEGYYIGHCLLGRRPIDGSIVDPAYDCSKVTDLQVAETEIDELSHAIAIDRQSILSEQISEENKLNIKGGEEMTEENKGLEVSALTMNDISRKLRNLVWELEREDYTEWYYLELVYPTENIAYLKRCGDKSLDEDFIKVSYSIDGNGDISIVSKEEVKMVFIPKESQVDVSEIKEELEVVKTELSEKVSNIVKLGETIKANEVIISERDKTISSLEVFKHQIEEIQAEQAKQEIAEKKTELKNKAISSGYITEEFIETSERLQKAISELNEDEVLKCVAEEVIKANSQKQTEVSSEEVETSEEDVEVSTDLGSTEEYEYKGSSGNSILDMLSNNKRR